MGSGCGSRHSTKDWKLAIGATLAQAGTTKSHVLVFALRLLEELAEFHGLDLLNDGSGRKALL